MKCSGLCNVFRLLYSQIMLSVRMYWKQANKTDLCGVALQVLFCVDWVLCLPLLSVHLTAME